MIKLCLFIILYTITSINGKNCTEQNFPILNCPINESSACCNNITTCIDTNNQISECLSDNCTAGPCSGCDFKNAEQGVCFNVSKEICCGGSTNCINATDDSEFITCEILQCSNLPCGFVNCDICGKSFECGFNGTEMLCNNTFQGIINTCVDKKDELSLCLTGICICIDSSPDIPPLPPFIPPISPSILVKIDDTAIIIAIIVGSIALLLIIIGLFTFFTNSKRNFKSM